jgi:transcriptional regulator with XRE-family HTH domain
VPPTPHTPEDSASFKGMGQAIATLRERRKLSRDELAGEAGLPVPSLQAIENGEADADWGTLRKLAAALDVSLGELIEAAEELAPGAGGEQWRRWTREAKEEREDRPPPRES